MSKSDQLTPYRRFFIIMGVQCVAAILANLLLRPGPVQDAQAVEYLRSISGTIETYYSNRTQLPSDFSDIKQQLTASTWQRIDKYDYIPLSSTTYRLCATFNAASEGNRGETMPYPGYGNDDPGRHTKGYQCFNNTVNLFRDGAPKPL